MDRRLAAILAMDMVGYSRLMEADEEGTLSRQTAHFEELVNPSIAKHRGRVVKTTGDGLLAEFSSVVDAVICAAEIQRGMPGREAEVDTGRRIAFRIGINLGDVVFEKGDIYGDGVNVAARIEPLADPGGICVSLGVFNAVRNKVQLGFEDVGVQDLKNISEPVQVFRVLLDPQAAGKLTTGRLKKPTPFWRQPAYIAAAAVIAVLGGGLAIRDAILVLPNDPVRRAGAGALEGSGDEGDPSRIAVLYLEDLTSDGRLGYLADGLTEGLIDALSQVSALHVVSRNGSLQYKDSDLPVDSIARALKAGTVVGGSVDQVGSRIRVNVALSEGINGTPFQRGSFEESSEDLFELQAGLVQEVSEFLRAWLGPEIELRRSVGETESVAAWALMQRGERARKDGEGLLNRDDLDGLLSAFQRADSLLLEAEAQDPLWARPVVMRGQLALRLGQIFAAEPVAATRWIDAGYGHTERALALDPRNAQALETRGLLSYVKWTSSLEPDPVKAEHLLVRAEEDLEEALRLQPTLANAWNVLSVVHSQKPDLIEAKISARRAYEEDAFLTAAESILWRLYATSYDLEQFPDAVQYCDEGKRRFPDSPRFAECELWLLASRALEPDVDRAWELLARMDSLESPQAREFRTLMGRMVVGGVLARAGLRDSANAVWEGSRGNPEIDPALELLGFEAVFRLQAGERDEAMRLVKTYLTASPEHRVGWRWTSHWWWRGLQDHPEFQQLVGSGAVR
jgi:serine/threonine-protein kinase